MKAIERFERYTVYTGDCIVWTGAVGGGYGRFGYKNRTWLAHKWIYEYHNGPVPEGLELDHLCRNRGCVNHGHLEPVTRSVNVLRGSAAESMRRIAAKRTHCKRGHPLANDSVMAKCGKGYAYKKCKACHRNWQLTYTKKMKEAACQANN